MEQLIQTDQQKGFDIAIGSLEWLLQQLVGQTYQARMPARGAEGQVLGQAAVARVHLAEYLGQAAAQRGLAREHDTQRTGCGQARVH